MPYLDLYTIVSALVGLLLGSILGYWLARLVFNHTAERLERKVLALSDNKFKLKGQRVRLKQLEQRLDSEAADVPQAELELQQKTQEISELTTALSDTTALTHDLTQELRERKARLHQLETELERWTARNEWLRTQTDDIDERITTTGSALAATRQANADLDHGEHDPDAQTVNGADEPADDHLHQIAARLARMESELGVWLHKVDELESSVGRQRAQDDGLSRLSQVLRGEAEKYEVQHDAPTEAETQAPELLDRSNGSGAA